MKKAARRFVASILYWQVARLRKKNNFQIIAVEGSIGKTSTKMAIAKLLASKYKVRHQEGNYNDLVTVPLIFFGQPLKSLFNPLAWLKIFISNEFQIAKKYPYEIVVIEVGTDGPGFMSEHARYLKNLDISVLTGIAPEHMEFFKDLDAVAAEETALTAIAGLNLINSDMCAAKYIKNIPQQLTYAINNKADYTLKNIKFDDKGCSFDILAAGQTIFSGRHEAISEPLLYAILAAVSLASKLGLNANEIEKGISAIKPAPGRMQMLSGVNNSKIIDDTYNASPEAVSAALKTLYRMEASQKIAILGNMNELGEYSKDAHEAVGRQCDSKQLDLVVTIGPDANHFLAPAAETNGCLVKTFDDPYQAGEFVKSNLKDKALVLAKGSQNKVFAEEAVKQLLATPADSARLVRQSAYWLKVKRKSFSR